MENNRINPSEFHGQHMEIKDDADSHTLEGPGSKNKMLFILVGFCIIISIGIGIGIYYQTRQKQSFGVFQNKAQSLPIMAESDPNKNVNLNSIIQPNSQNSTEPITYKAFVLQHYKPDNLNLKYYGQYLPKNKSNQTIMDLNDIFESKYLYINNKKIKFDYIYTIRQNDFQEKGVRNATFQNDNSSFYNYDQKDGQISLRDFYELCEDENPTNQKKLNSLEKPLISVIIAVYNVHQNLLRTIKSIQNQSLKNLEIIIIDELKINLSSNCSSTIENDPRIRVFLQKKSFGLWRKRMDGFLYSRGEYILHVDAGHILADNLVLEDIYNIAKKYDLDTVRFSFSRTVYNDDFIKKKSFDNMKMYPSKHTKIIYGRPDYDVHQFGYGTIWNRLVRADMFSKGLDLVDNTILNSKKNLWEDMWWNDLIDRVSFSNLVVNRLGYIFLYNRNITYEPFIRNKEEKNRAINEFIYFWYFDLILLPKNDDKKVIVNTLRKYNDTNNTFCKLPMKLSFLKRKSSIFKHLIKKLLSDSYVSFNDKMYIKELSDSVRHMVKEKKDKKKANKKSKKIAKKKKQDKKHKQVIHSKTTLSKRNNLNNSLKNSSEYKNITNLNKSQITKIIYNQTNQHNITNIIPNNVSLINNQNPYNNYQQNRQDINQLNQNQQKYNNNINQNIQNNNFGQNNLPYGNQMQQNYNGQMNNNQPYINNQINQNNFNNPNNLNQNNIYNNQNNIPAINNVNGINNQNNNQNNQRIQNINMNQNNQINNQMNNQINNQNNQYNGGNNINIENNNKNLRRR